MKVNLKGYDIYKNKSLKKGLEFVANHGALFSAGASLTLATIARPIAIYSTPKTDKENRKLACAKSISSSAIGFGLMLGASLPVSKSIAKIDKKPDKYLKKSTINALKDTAKPLISSGGYQFATQLFKLGIGTAFAIPKALITCALIPFVVNAFGGKKNNEFGKDDVVIHKTKPINGKTLNFTGRIPKEPLTKGIARVINSPTVQNFANKYKDTNYAMHITALTDTVATGTFIAQTSQSNKIQESRKRPLIYNSAIATGLSIASSYVVDKSLNKPTEKFIEKFKKANKGSAKIDKYVEGIRIAKPALIMGSIYYCIIPLISTFFAERIHKKDKVVKCNQVNKKI